MKKFSNVEARVTGYMGETQKTDAALSRADTYNSADKRVPNQQKATAGNRMQATGSAIMMEGGPKTKAQQMREKMGIPYSNVGKEN